MTFRVRCSPPRIVVSRGIFPFELTRSDGAFPKGGHESYAHPYGLAQELSRRLSCATRGSDPVRIFRRFSLAGNLRRIPGSLSGSCLASPRRGSSIRSRATFFPWFYRILRNHGEGCLRERRRFCANDAKQSSVAAPSETMLAQSEQLRSMAEAIQILPERRSFSP